MANKNKRGTALGAGAESAPADQGGLAGPGEDRLEIVMGGLVRVADAAAFLALSRSKLYQIMDRGQLAYIKIDGSRRIPRRALENFAANGLITGSTA